MKVELSWLELIAIIVSIVGTKSIVRGKIMSEIKPEIKESQEIGRGIVALAKTLAEAKASNGIGLDDMALLFKIAPELNAAIDNAWGAKDEFKNYNRENIAVLATELSAAFPENLHAAVYIQAAFDLVDAGVKAFEAINSIVDAVKSK